jgi:hypothetical protein
MQRISPLRLAGTLSHVPLRFDFPFVISRLDFPRQSSEYRIDTIYIDATYNLEAFGTIYWLS